MPELLKRPRPVMRGPARFQEHRRGRLCGEKREQPRAAQPMLFIHTSGVVRDGDLKDGDPHLGLRIRS
jgi:hypothetical protein